MRLRFARSHYNLIHAMRKPDFHLCENKDADWLRATVLRFLKISKSADYYKFVEAMMIVRHVYHLEQSIRLHFHIKNKQKKNNTKNNST